jgi:hypothetical protein
MILFTNIVDELIRLQPRPEALETPIEVHVKKPVQSTIGESLVKNKNKGY